LTLIFVAFVKAGYAGDMDCDLLVIGASVRAAAFSAIRAGLRPWAIDLFADRDLAAVCPVQTVPASRYPNALVEMAKRAPPGPWLYTGALENWPELVEQIAQDRPLWGNDAACLNRVRDPFTLADACRTAGVPCPEVRRLGDRLTESRWLLKPLASGGGTGIRFAGNNTTGRSRDPARHCYSQEFIEGESRAGLFVANGGGCKLLGVTRQLVGDSWLHARRFRYAGNVGPLSLTPTERNGWERLGAVIARFARLRGLFGIDAIGRDGVPWPVEVNPRYTASAEVIEYATGLRALVLHGKVFETANCDVFPPVIDRGLNTIVGKAVWYAPRTITFPTEGPWETVFRRPFRADDLPSFADVPRAGERIAAGRPVLTIFATGATTAECEARLRTIAGELDARLLK
jgi:uncharacterized protein